MYRNFVTFNGDLIFLLRSATGGGGIYPLEVLTFVGGEEVGTSERKNEIKLDELRVH